MLLLPLLLLLLVLLPALAVYIGWPMDEQLPNVARVNQTYLFLLASTTYKSSAGGSITYTASNLPAWLSFDGALRTFLGTPADSDLGTFDITLTGTDSADTSVLARNYLMLVSDSAGLALSAADVMFVSIAQYGRTNGADGLVVRQGQEFSIQFSTDVFTLEPDAEMPIVAYYGRSEDRTSLPNWINFDSDSLTFSGTVPEVTSDIAPSISYGFSFIASDYAGYAGAEGTFQLVVGAHELSTSQNESLKMNGTFGSDFDYTVPIFSSVYLDDTLIEQANISSVTADDLPSYVTFNEDDYSLSGTFPNRSTFDNFTVVVEDVFGNEVQLPYSFESIGSVFTVNSLANVNATKGEYFVHQLLESDFTDFDDTTIAVSFNASWLSYHKSNVSLVGKAPSNLNLVSVTVKASSSFDDESRSFRIVGVDREVTSSTSSSSASSSTSYATSTVSSLTTATTLAAAAAAVYKLSNSHKKLAIGLGVGIPLFAVLVAAALIFFCCSARRKKRSDTEKSALEEPELNGPGFGVTHDLDDHQETAHQLNALHALKINDSNSILSCETHVDSSSSGYFDAVEKPMKSWRAEDNSDNVKAQFLREQKHASLFSLDTVNTSNLFSMRLVDDNSKRDSDFGSNRDLTGSENFQRLDSDGNIVAKGQEPISPTTRPTSLTNINEEHTEEHQGENFYSTTHESSSYNLMAKFLSGSNSPSNSDFEDQAQYFGEDFQPVKDSVGNIQWRASKEALTSPSSEKFLLDLEDTPKNENLLSTTTYSKRQSKSSIFSDLSDLNVVESRELKAKLVNFTRKASLRESARLPKLEHPGETAQIHNGDSD